MAARKAPAAPVIGRRLPKRDKLKKIYIYCEGSVTEPEYLDSLFREYGRGKFVIEINKACGAPTSIVDKCKNRRDALRRSKEIIAGDQIWAVFDVDEHLNIKDCVSRANDCDILVAVSNPCIEVWGIFHHELQSAPLTRFQAQAKLAKIMPPYHHDKHPILDWNIYGDKVNVAIKNSIVANKARKDDGARFPNNTPSTTFFHLVLTMIDGLNEKVDFVWP